MAGVLISIWSMVGGMWSVVGGFVLRPLLTCVYDEFSN